MHGVGNAPSPTRGGTVTPLFVVLFVLSAPLFLHPFPSTLAPSLLSLFFQPLPKDVSGEIELPGRGEARKRSFWMDGRGSTLPKSRDT